MQSCLSLYRWMPQYRPPQRHVKPVGPTFFLQSAHLFFFFLVSLGSSFSSATAAAGEATAAAPSVVEILGSSSSATAAAEAEEEAVVASVSFSLSWSSVALFSSRVSWASTSSALFSWFCSTFDSVCTPSSAASFFRYSL